MVTFANVAALGSPEPGMNNKGASKSNDLPFFCEIRVICGYAPAKFTFQRTPVILNGKTSNRGKHETTFDHAVRRSAALCH